MPSLPARMMRVERLAQVAQAWSRDATSERAAPPSGAQKHAGLLTRVSPRASSEHHLPSLRNNALLIRIQMFESDTCAVHHAVERILGEGCRNARAAIHELGEIAKL